MQLPRCGRFGPSSTGTDFKLRHHGRAYAVGTRRSTASPPPPPSPSRRRSRRRRSRPARAAPCRLPGRGLIAGTMATVVVEEAPGASAHSSVLTLVNSSIGAGILALPLAFSCTGWAGGLAAVAFIACTEGFTLYVLARCAESTGARTYGALVRAGGAAPTQNGWGQHPACVAGCACPAALALALHAVCCMPYDVLHVCVMPAPSSTTQACTPLICTALLLLPPTGAPPAGPAHQPADVPGHLALPLRLMLRLLDDHWCVGRKKIRVPEGGGERLWPTLWLATSRLITSRCPHTRHTRCPFQHF